MIDLGITKTVFRRHLPVTRPVTFNPKTEIDLEQEQTPMNREQAESTERRLGPEKLWNERFANALSATPSRSVSSITSCEMTSAFGFKTVRDDGFTLIELLVVMGTVAILATLLLPALAGTKPNSQSFQCLENLRQLTLGWQMYAGDNNGRLAPNGSQVDTPSTPTDPKILPGGVWVQWCPGNMSTYSPYATNFIQVGVIYPYVKTLNVYKCPADSAAYKFGVLIIPHARSYSMNCFLAPITDWPSIGVRTFFKDSDLNKPGPSMTFVFIGESEYSINDGFFVSDPTQGNYWQDVPASRHGGAGGLSYADGHTEMKRWTDSGILNYNGRPTHSIAGDPNSSDAAWLQQRATSLIQ